MNESARLWALGGFAVLFALFTTLRADDDETLRKEVMNLNDIIGMDLIQGKIDELSENKEMARKFLKIGSEIAKEDAEELNHTAAHILATVAEKLEDKKGIETFYTLVMNKAIELERAQQAGSAYLKVATVLSEQNRYEELEKLSAKFLGSEGPVNGFKILALQQVIISTAYQGKTDQAFKHLKAFEALLENVSDGEIQKDLRYRISGLYIEVGDVDKATEHLQKLLEDDPDNPSFNNDLGYIWADNDRNLDEAQRMIEKALKVKPDDAAYLDSLGWVYFKKKEFAKAKEQLLLAVAAEQGQHIEILDHLGDVHLALGEKEEAITVWKKAIEIAEETYRQQKRRAEIEKKLKENGG